MLYIVELLAAFSALALLFVLVGGLPLVLCWGWVAHPRGARWTATFVSIGVTCIAIAAAALALALHLNRDSESLAAPFFAWFVAAPLAVLSGVGFADSWRSSHSARQT